MTSKLVKSNNHLGSVRQSNTALRKERDYWKEHSHELEETILELLNDLKAYQSFH